MNCMKCGVEIPADKVFCTECLADMERHPVKSDTPVILPQRDKQSTSRRSHHRKNIKPEEHINTLRKVIFWLLMFTIVLMLLLTVAALALIHVMQGNELPFQISADLTNALAQFENGFIF